MTLTLCLHQRSSLLSAPKLTILEADTNPSLESLVVGEPTFLMRKCTPRLHKRRGLVLRVWRNYLWERVENDLIATLLDHILFEGAAHFLASEDQRSNPRSHCCCNRTSGHCAIIAMKTWVGT